MGLLDRLFNRPLTQVSFAAKLIEHFGSGYLATCGEQAGFFPSNSAKRLRVGIAFHPVPNIDRKYDAIHDDQNDNPAHS